jgi:tetratricopeptide (TPR) repeat protein
LSGSAEALMSVGWTLTGSFNDPAVDHDRVVKEFDEISSRAIRADRANPAPGAARTRALAPVAMERGVRANAEALRIDPYRNSTLGDRALLILTGRPEEALPLLEQAIALDPRGPGWRFSSVPMPRLPYSAATMTQSWPVRSRSPSDYWLRHVYLVAAYAQKGDLAKAAVAKTELLKRRPDMSIASYRAQKASDNPIFQQQNETYLFAGLRKAGIPEN